uniref:Late embryogenesis abundant protein LEA-2 subgroup domain-containing protein n=1 Tax=Kalanchoe fedtschenkoi TaxID=63787 RepID=A0A7N0UJW6_KALFE
MGDGDKSPPTPQHHPPPPAAHHHPKIPDPKHAGGDHHHHDDSDRDDDTQLHRQRHHHAAIAKGVAIFLLLLGLAALITWLVYRPELPQFTVSAVSIYALNVTTATVPPLLSASLQVTVLLRNPNKRVSIHYDRLSARVTYRDHPITPATPLPPLRQRTRSLVSAAPTLGAQAVPVAAEVASGLAADEAFGVLGLRVVVAGTVRWKAGAIKTSRKRMTAACDVVVGYRGGAPGQVPMLSAPRCRVDV